MRKLIMSLIEMTIIRFCYRVMGHYDNRWFQFWEQIQDWAWQLEEKVYPEAFMTKEEQEEFQMWLESDHSVEE